ncbi:hypothetical protein FB451DRAFT_1407111 [Mycena latifolia]|nr:hypothetical protein FB451DRAFT_1407111 [Mycena latifolia]
MPAQGKRKPRQRVSKENRRNLRLWAEGARETILSANLEDYADALERGWRAERDSVQNICNEFHAKISWRLKDHEEPDLPLPDFDPLAVLPEEVLSEEEQAVKQARKDVLNARIRRWLKYRVRRLRKQLRTRLDPCKDPWAILLARLSGIKQPPKARQGYQQFMHKQHKTTIAPVVAEKWAETATPGNSVQTAKDPNGPFRAKVACELFAALPEEEQSAFAVRAKSEAAAAREKYDTDFKKPPSKAPADRQDCIDRLGTFLAPVLQGIQELTGLHSVVVLGGPMPKYSGELKTIYVSYGRTKSARASHFPEWAKDRWNSVLDLMKEYLTVAFSTQEKEEAAIPEALLAGAKYTIPPDPNGDDSDSESSESSNSNADSDDTDAPASKKKTSAKKVKDVGVSGRSKKAAPAAAASRGTDTTHDAAAKTKERGGKAPVKAKVKAKDKEKGKEKQRGTKGSDEGPATPGKKRKKKKGPREDESESDETQDENDILATPAKRRRKKTRGEGGSNASDDEDDYPGPSTPAAADKTPNKRACDGDDEPAPPTRKSRRLNPESASASGSGPASAPPIPAEPSTAMSAPPVTPAAINPATPASAPPAQSTPPAAAPEAAPSTAASAPVPSSTPALPSGPASTPAPLQPPPENTSPPSGIPSTSTAPAKSAAPAPPWTPSADPPPPLSAALTALPSLTAAPAAALSAPVVSISTPAPSIVIAVPADAPAWLRDSIADLTKVDLGCNFASVLAALIR